MSRRGNGEGSITRHKASGKWMARYTIETPSGQKRRTIYATTRAEVAKKLNRAIADYDSGLIFDDQRLTVGEYFERWMSDSVRGSVRESTYSRDAYLVEKHIRPSLGRIKLKNLNAMQIQCLYRDRQDQGGLSASTVQKIHHVLHKGLGQAVAWDLISRNPADAVKPPAPKPKDMRPLSAGEARQFLDAAKDNRLEALYVLAIQTGMRRGELLGLGWGDVDLENHKLRVQRTLTRIENGRRLDVGEPKTKQSRRTVSLTPGAVASLKSHRIRQAEERLKAGSLYQDVGTVFAGDVGNFINPSNLLQRSFKPLLKEAFGENPPAITFHDLRHTCASLLFQKNVHPKFVQELLGHSSVSITLDTYSHMLPGMGGEAAGAMMEVFG